MKNLKVNGLIKIDGMEFHDIEGGFGEGRKSMLVKEIANIHGREQKHINELINKYRERFKNKVDIIDLKSVVNNDRDFLISLGFSNSSISNAKNIYILSERGYSKLLKILEDDFAWKQYDKLVDGYFNMRERINNNNMLEGVSKELQAIIMHDKKIQEVNTRVDKLENNMTIDTRQQNMLSKAGRKRTIGLLGGKNSLAYKNLSSKAFSALWHEYKDYFELGSYKDTPSIKFDEGLEFVTDWNLTNELRMEIKRLGNKEIA